MRRFLLASLVTLTWMGVGMDEAAWARGRASPKYAAPTWHGDYYEAGWGMPLALVVPPNAERQVHYGWGVGATRTTPIEYQYQPGFPIPGYYHRAQFLPVPQWPSSTDQLGVYPIRGPW